jgi:citrate lyase subunit beta/citryl-CoA lyase
MIRPFRPRRSCLSVPGSSPKMMIKAQGLDVDMAFLDLEDAVAPSAKVDARKNVIAALQDGDWEGKVVAVRVNDAETRWAYDDVIEIVRGAGSLIDCIMLPKVEKLSHIHWLDVLLSQLERDLDLPQGGIGIEVQIEGPSGLSIVDDIAASTPRVETLIFGPGDFMAAMQIPALVIGQNSFGGHNPIDPVFMMLAMTARKYGLQVIDGPYAVIGDLEGFERAAVHATAFGFDGKWVLHPTQVDVANSVFSPSQESYDKSEAILEAYGHSRSAAGGGRGAAMLDGEMIDEASRKLALVTAEKGRRAGLKRTPSSSA